MPDAKVSSPFGNGFMTMGCQNTKNKCIAIRVFCCKDNSKAKEISFHKNHNSTPFYTPCKDCKGSQETKYHEGSFGDEVKINNIFIYA
jgi:hypothetical protein